MIQSSRKVEVFVPHVGYIEFEDVGISKNENGLLIENNNSEFEINYPYTQTECREYVSISIANAEVRIWK